VKQRIITGIIAGIGFIGIVFLGGYWFAGLMLLMAALGYHEFLRMNRIHAFSLTGLVGAICVLWLAIPWETLTGGAVIESEAVVWLTLFALLAITVLSKNKITIDHVSMMFLGIVYIGFGFDYMTETRLSEHGLYWTFLLFLCIWATDSGAYFTGTWLGKTPLWPTISPKKSVEGALGGILLSIVIALLFASAKPELLTWGQAVLIGAVIAVVGQLGDLMQSAYKRVKGIKDTGAILPGHGGVLDRVDSWLIVFPAVHLLGLIPH
jgi:phosphatidate cytidylyltransferase